MGAGYFLKFREIRDMIHRFLLIRLIVALLGCFAFVCLWLDIYLVSRPPMLPTVTPYRRAIHQNTSITLDFIHHLSVVSRNTSAPQHPIPIPAASSKRFSSMPVRINQAASRLVCSGSFLCRLTDANFIIHTSITNSFSL